MGNAIGGQGNSSPDKFTVDSLYAMGKNASQAEIKSAFKKGALIYHPDKGGDPEQFRQLCEAYQILMDPVKRSQYERGGGLDISQMSADEIFAWLDTQEEEGEAPSDPTSDQDRKMMPYHVDVWVDESVAMRGTRLQREVRRQVNKSKGRVARPSPQCHLCRGTGKVTQIIRNKSAASRITESCSCVPKLTENTHCITEGVQIDVPAGAKEGHEILIPNKGHECMGFSAGDLIFTVRLETRSAPPNIRAVPQAQRAQTDTRGRTHPYPQGSQPSHSTRTRSGHPNIGAVPQAQRAQTDTRGRTHPYPQGSQASHSTRTRSGHPNIGASVPRAQSTPQTRTKNEHDAQVETTTKTDTRSSTRDASYTQGSQHSTNSGSVPPNPRASVSQARSTPLTVTRSENYPQMETTTNIDTRSNMRDASYTQWSQYSTKSGSVPPNPRASVSQAQSTPSTTTYMGNILGSLFGSQTTPAKEEPDPYMPPRDQDSFFGWQAKHSTEEPGPYMPPRDQDGNLIYNCAPISLDDI